MGTVVHYLKQLAHDSGCGVYELIAAILSFARGCVHIFSHVPGYDLTALLNLKYPNCQNIR